MIRTIPRYHPICALLNQFSSLLSTSLSMSLRLNSWDSLLALERLSKEDILIIILTPSEVIFDLWVGGHQYFCVNSRSASLHFAQNYPSSVSNTLQSWCRTLKVFYQTSLMPLCNVFCHVYEKSLIWLEIDNISSVSAHEPKSSDKFFCFHLQMDGYW